MSPIDHKSALIQAIAWCWNGNKPLAELMLTQFIDEYMDPWPNELMVKREPILWQAMESQAISNSLYTKDLDLSMSYPIQSQ